MFRAASNGIQSDGYMSRKGCLALSIALSVLFSQATRAERVRDRLESFPLSDLCVVSIESTSTGFRAVVEDPQGMKEVVFPGSFLGQDHGRVFSITALSVEISEIVLGKDGEWREQPAAIQVCEEPADQL